VTRPEFPTASGRPNHHVRGIDELRLDSRGVIRRLDAVPGEKPVPSLTLVVSLEAIFLSTFVMIGQNRRAAFQQAKSDHDFEAQDLELKTNTDLTRKSICSQWSCIGV
jgi:hypothetical protein